MTSQSESSTSAPMPHTVVIPASVPALGQLSRLPDELILMIFKTLVLSLFPAGSKLYECINQRTFNVLNRLIRITNIRKVSIAFAGFLTKALFENFHVSFKLPIKYHLIHDHKTFIPNPIPPLHLRHHVRSMHIEVVLQNYYFRPDLNPDVLDYDASERERRRINTAEEMIKFCPSALFLLRLTDPDHGFGRLRFLHLHFHTRFRFFPVDDAYYRVLEDVNFVLTARKVKLTVKEGLESSEVMKRIVVRQ
ncbi:hypothetical protein OPT61_g1732 [Boeremia exigua]|uniref:Uncharacterized protein n=1 Tax=Boeremia exigua TaxID=749465 RepID=A0ACC2IP20_9PLEO|nr:hypothetical protein OPT61_g1732 [Boeremia exigua]